MGKISRQKVVRIKFSVDSAFSNMFYGKNGKPEMLEINRKLFKSKKHPVLTFYRYYKTAKKQSLCYLSTILALITKKLPSSFNGKFSLITLSNTLRVKS